MTEMTAEARRLLALYRPRVGRGNFQADVAARGGNEMLRRAIVSLGLLTRAEVDAEFRRRDDDDWNRSQAVMARLEAEDRARA